MDLERGYVATPRGQIHFRASGSGAPLVLLHPTHRSSRLYARFLPMLDGVRAIAIDCRGFGASSPLEGPTTMEELAQDVVHVLDGLGLPRAHLLGLHTGNKIAAAAAAGWPERVDRVVLVGMSHSIVPDREARNAAMRAVMGGMPPFPAGPRTRSEHLARWSALFRRVSGAWWRASVISSDELTADDLDALAEEVLDEIEGRVGFDATYAANFAFDFAGALARIERPTLIVELAVAAEQHLGVQSPELERLVRDCRTVLIDRDDRRLLWDEPRRLAEPVLEFLEAAAPR